MTRRLLDGKHYSIDLLLDIQERLLIEDPVGKDAGFWTVFEVVQSMKHAFYFKKDEFGDMGANVWRIF